MFYKPGGTREEAYTSAHGSLMPPATPMLFPPFQPSLPPPPSPSCRFQRSGDQHATPQAHRDCCNRQCLVLSPATALRSNPSPLSGQRRGSMGRRGAGGVGFAPRRPFGALERDGGWHRSRPRGCHAGRRAQASGAVRQVRRPHHGQCWDSPGCTVFCISLWVKSIGRRSAPQLSGAPARSCGSGPRTCRELAGCHRPISGAYPTTWHKPVDPFHSS